MHRDGLFVYFINAVRSQVFVVYEKVRPIFRSVTSLFRSNFRKAIGCGCIIASIMPKEREKNELCVFILIRHVF